jgi:YesN/AraC family two-component response regulator
MQELNKMLEKVKHLKLLYIEDNEDVMQSTVGLFANIFDDITTACDGEDALEKLEACNYDYDLIITDINMPKVDGYEVIEKIRKHNTALKVYILSAYNQIDNIKKAGSSVDAYLYKPLSIQKLFEILGTHYG